MTPRPASLPPGCPARFLVTVHGTVFAGREAHLCMLRQGDGVELAPGHAEGGHPEVQVRRTEGEVLGHLPPEVAEWLAPWLTGGGRAEGRVVRVRGEDAPSYRRLSVEVICREG